MYLIPHGELIRTPFKSSRYLNAEYTSNIAFRGVPGLPKENLQVLYADQSGIDSTPAQGFEHMDLTHRTFFQIHKQVHDHLVGKRLKTIITKLIEKFHIKILSKSKNIQTCGQCIVVPIYMTLCGLRYSTRRRRHFSVSLYSRSGKNFSNSFGNFKCNFQTCSMELPSF